MAIQSPFVWGAGGAQLTPEEIAKRREIEDALLAQGVDTSPVGSAWEGLARVANAAAGSFRRGRLARAEADNKAYDEKAFNNIIGLLGGGAAPAAPVAASAPAALPAPAVSGEISKSDPIAEVLAAGGNPVPGDTSWLRYANGGATRSQPLDPKLVSALGFLPELGVSAEVFSGGQPTAAEGGPRTGSERHDHGGAGDMFFYKDGRKLDWANDQDRPIFEEIVRRGKAAGITGFGAGDGYMQPGSMHVGFGAPAVWGAGGRGSNAPGWLRSAYAGAPAASTASDAIEAVAPLGGPATAYAPPLPAPRTVAAPPPVASAGPVEVAQAAPQVMAPNVAAIPPAIIQVLSDPRVSERTRSIAQILLKQNMDRQNALLEQQMKQSDPGYQTELQLKRAQLNQILNPQMSPGEKATLDFNREKLDVEQQNRNTLTAAEKAQNDLAREKFGYERENGALTPDLKEYRAYAEGEKAAGRQPLGLLDYQIAVKRAGANSTTVNTGEGSKFYGKLDEQNAQMFSNLSDGAVQARSKLGQIDRLEQLMSKAPQGAVGALKQAAGEWGIPTTGLSDIQAASALLESLVPQQRPPGSGTMSDSDIKMYRASLPRLLNQPGGNQLIFQTMRGIAQYEMQMGDIADRVANREITPAEGRSLIKSLKNPLADFKPPADGPTPNEGWKELPGVPGGAKIRLKGSQ